MNKVRSRKNGENAGKQREYHRMEKYAPEKALAWFREKPFQIKQK